MFRFRTFIRNYDRKRYLKEKKRLKKSTSLESIPLSEHFDLFKTYTMGQDLPIQCAIQLLKEEGSKPVRGVVSFPHSVGADTTSKILVFATGQDAEKAKQAGAHYVGGEELIQDVLDGKVQFDRCVSTRQMFPQVIKIARVLGPKGLMPSPAKGTVSDDVVQMLASLRSSTKFEEDEDGTIQAEIGTSVWTNDKLEHNVKEFVKSVISLKPSKTDVEKFIENVVVYTQYTPGLLLPKKPFRAAK